MSERLSRGVLTQIPKLGIVLVLVVVLVLGALGFRDRKETDVLQLICSVSLIAKRSEFSRTRTTTSTRTTPQIRNLVLRLKAENLFHNIDLERFFQYVPDG